MVAKFSPNGLLLAFHCIASTKSNHEILVMDVNQLQIVHSLVGHLFIVYDITWLNDDTLVTASSDRTAIIWFLTEKSFKMKVRNSYVWVKYFLHVIANYDGIFQVLPHPSFIYAAKWLRKSTDFTYLATGGRDCVLRIWKISTDEAADIELCDELIQHDNYITSIATNRKSVIYTADWNGCLFEWGRQSIAPIFQLRR